MKRIILLRALVCFWGALLFMPAYCFEPDSKKKLIELGWDIPTTEYIAKHWRAMEANAPFAGILYDLVGKDPSGKTYSSQKLFTSDAWEQDWFASCVDDMKSCDFQRYRDNFIRINFYPAPFDWNDDEAWKNICGKMAICAWVARETGGNLSFDFESYGSQMFQYDPSTGRTFKESKELARRRGKETILSIVDVYPQVKILCLWMNSINLAVANSAEISDFALCSLTYGLLPSFIDGMLDGLSLEAILIDGCESGYYMNGAAQYDRAACDMLSLTGPAISLVSPENRQKYRSQVQAGFGFYLDMYSNPEGSIYYRGAEPGETRFDRLSVNLRAALNASDQYVWVYGEQKRWWAPENVDSEDDWISWEEALPGITDLILELNEPQEMLKVMKNHALTYQQENLIKNGSFEEFDANARLSAWSTWQIETKPLGAFTSEDGAAALKGMVNGCYLQSIPVKPGEKYLVVGNIGARGNSYGNFRVRWKNKDKKWTHETRDVLVFPKKDAPTDDFGMRETLELVVVPDDVYWLVLLLSASGGDPNGTVFFDDVGVYRVVGTNESIKNVAK